MVQGLHTLSIYEQRIRFLTALAIQRIILCYRERLLFSFDSCEHILAAISISMVVFDGIYKILDSVSSSSLKFSLYSLLPFTRFFKILGACTCLKSVENFAVLCVSQAAYHTTNCFFAILASNYEIEQKYCSVVKTLRKSGFMISEIVPHQPSFPSSQMSRHNSNNQNNLLV